MDRIPKFFLLTAVFFAFAGLSAASSFISDNAFASHGSGERSLLQAKTSCPVNFEFMNYTIITSTCKGPRYPATECCGALKEFACPYSEELNDLTNDCASTMFSYINLNGKYPPGLFANECQEGKKGIDCPASAPQALSESSGSSLNQHIFSVFFLTCAIVLGLLFS